MGLASFNRARRLVAEKEASKAQRNEMQREEKKKTPQKKK